MVIIATAGRKGGSGKTTAAVNLAAFMARVWPRVLLVDADEVGGASGWADRAENAGFSYTTESDPARLAHLPTASGWDVVVVDTPTGSVGARTAAEVAHLVVTPTPPGDLDIRALVATVYRDLTPAGADYRVLLSRAHPRRLGEAAQASQALTEAGIPTLATVVREYQAHRDAAAAGSPITGWRGRGAEPARGDYHHLATEILDGWPPAGEATPATAHPDTEGAPR